MSLLRQSRRLKHIHLLLPLPLCFLPLFVCLSVCLSVRSLDYSTSYERILMKFLEGWGGVAQGTVD